MNTTSARTRRVLGVTAAALVIPTTLTGCFFGPQGPQSVDFDGVQSATIQLQAEGSFVAPGTLDPTPFGSRGSGFFISSDGLAVTNNHVVTGAGTLKVWVGGSQDTTYGAQVLGASECLDLAVVRVDGDSFPFMSWREEPIEAALDVYAAGFPLGDPNFTLTRGIVSKADVAQDFNWASLDHVIEHDARIRGGNSGGPLVDEKGKVVGVNYAGNDTFDYSFAIHRDQVKGVLDKLIAGEPVLTIGVNAEALPPTEDGNSNGVWISSVQAGGPADLAGVEPGDIIASLGGVVVARQGTLEEYCEVIRTQGVDGVIDIEVYRPSENAMYSGQINGAPLEKEGGSEPTPTPPPVGSFVNVSDDSGRVGVTVPDTWAQVVGVPVEGNGIQFANVTASPDIAAFNSSWSTPGVSVSATQDMSVSIDTYLDSYASSIGDQCASGEPGEYDDGLYAGRYIYFAGCGGGDTDFLALVAVDADGTHQMLLTVQMVTETDKTVVLEQILNSFVAQF
ncbi:S1C family serine protease [Schumannella luteola]